jgi:hypothetical protein
VRKHRVKLRAAIFVILLVSNPASSQTTWGDYYPLHIGDFWEYRLYENYIPIKNSVKVIGDTLMPNGHAYKIMKYTEHDGPYPGSRLSFTRVDTMGQVWSYSPYMCPDRLLYRLSAQVGDTLHNPCLPDSLTYWKLVERMPAIVFGDTTEIQTWDWINSPVLGVKTLAGGFGLVIELGEGVERYLLGAIIKGRKYGDITVSVQEELKSPPKGYSLAQNYPNPFNPRTTIEYSLHTKQHVALKVFDCLGREVVCLVDEVQDPGRHYVQWNGKDWRGRAVSSGVYFYRIQGPSLQDTRKLIYLR